MVIFNNLGRERQEFVTRDPGAVGMYVCGPTVQSAPHLGHGRAAVVFDVVRRYLAWKRFEVTYVVNVTDVDDKIINAAALEGITTEEVASRSLGQFREAYRLLGVLPPTVEPRATEHIAEMIEIVERLIAAGHAYESGGDVYFSVRSFPEYGKLSGHDIDQLQSGARIEPGEHKRDPLDFAVWKASKPGEPSWESPWGPGRPGWHIECSAMSAKYLGFGFDIHAGGQDLIFPHHENEIAQSEAAAGSAPFARYWIHNGMVNLSGEKMAKSTGHVISLLEALDRYPPAAVRLFYLRTHYRKPVEFTEDAMADAIASLERLWAFRRRLPAATSATPEEQTLRRFSEVMDEDFDAAGGLAVLFETVREGNRRLDAGEDAGSLAAAYDEMAGVFGVAEPSPDLDDLTEDLEALAAAYAVEGGGGLAGAAATLEALVQRRQEAREAREWEVTDGIRDRLAGLGIVVEDTPDGPRWHRR
jgi:cysteinyl-tRNA synthetase